MKIAALLALLTFSLPPQYASVFGEDYRQACLLYNKNQVQCKQLALSFEQDNNLLTAIVFPEWIRYSSFMNFIETEALEVAYVNYGSSISDFSIGFCQMKPSFAEDLENEILKDANLKAKYSLLIPSEPESSAERKKRLANLNDFSIQWVYLCAFTDILGQKFPNISKKEPIEKVKFYATAYNSGWNRAEEDIFKQADKATFPYGSKIPASFQYKYADIAADFYTNLTSQN